jgi:hypothetical protein
VTDARHDYSQNVLSALRLIAKYGEPCTWVKPAPADPAAKPWRDTRDGDPVDFDCMIAFFSGTDLSRGSTPFKMYNAGTEVTGYSLIGLMAPTNFDPELTDTLTRTSGKADIVWIDIVAPSGVPVLYYIAIK